MRMDLSSGLLTRDDRFPVDLPKASNKDSEMEKKNDFLYSTAHLGVTGASHRDDSSHLLP